MFAAAATLAQMALDIAIASARFLATKTILLAMLAIVLPFVLQGVFIWGFEYMIEYSRIIAEHLTSSLSNMTQGNYDVNIQLSGIGGYLAIQTGLIDYCSIIFTGWGLYWVVAVLAKTSRVI